MQPVVTYAGLSAEGEELRSMQNRLTWALRVSGHVLRITHEHTSAPIGFEIRRRFFIEAVLHERAGTGHV